MLDVIDVSRWQGTIDWKKVKASGKVGGVMIRAVSTKSGQLYVDPCFEANYAGAKSERALSCPLLWTWRTPI